MNLATVMRSISLVKSVNLGLPELIRANRGVLYTSNARTNSYLVDPASSHMLVSKIKPCMSKYKQVYCETANGSLNQL